MAKKDSRSKDRIRLSDSMPQGNSKFRQFLILLKKRSYQKVDQNDRQGIYRIGLDRTKRFRSFLTKWIKEEGLSSEVSEIGKATSFPVLSILCTPAVAKKIRKLPEVETIVKDSGGLQLLYIGV